MRNSFRHAKSWLIGLNKRRRSAAGAEWLPDPWRKAWIGLRPLRRNSNSA
jgi:hypothetical protein